jgi:two-component system cell cycle response regulator
MNSQQPIDILIVDDIEENLVALEAILESPDLNIVKASSGNEALSLMFDYNFALVLMDVQMPEMDGYETAEIMRNNKQLKQTPILFVTAINKQEQHIFKGYEKGAVDYLFKPLDPQILKCKVNVFLELFRQRKSLEKTGERLKKTVSELKQANKKIKKQQEAIIEEEKLNVLLQMAGATAHELNQPLMILLGNIELLEISQENPDTRKKYIKKIKDAGMRISACVNKIQNIRHMETRSHDSESTIIDLDQ